MGLGLRDSFSRVYRESERFVAGTKYIFIRIVNAHDDVGTIHSWVSRSLRTSPFVFYSDGHIAGTNNTKSTTTNRSTPLVSESSQPSGERLRKHSKLTPGIRCMPFASSQCFLSPKPTVPLKYIKILSISKHCNKSLVSLSRGMESPPSTFHMR